MSTVRKGWRWCVLLCLALTWWGCAGDKGAQGEPGEVAPPRPSVDRPDPGPKLRREVAVEAPEVLPGDQQEALGVLRRPGALYLEATVPAQLDRWLDEGYGRHLLHTQLEQAQGTVFVQTGRREPDQRRRMFLRLRQGQAPSQVTVRLHGAPRWAYSGRQLQSRSTSQRVTVTLPPSLPEDAQLEARFYRAGAGWFEGRAQSAPGKDGFSSYAAERLRRRALGASSTGGAAPEAPRQARRTDLGSLMSFYTGLDSVEETLQADRGLLPGGDRGTQARTLPLAQLQGLPQPPHPWARMRAELPGGGQFTTEPLADAAPQDMIYLHFHDLRSLIKLSEELDTWVQPLGLAVEGGAGPAHFTARYERQLGLESSGLARSAGHLAADGVAVLLGDPYLREGTDVSLLFQVKNLALLRGALAGYEQKLKAAGLELTREAWSYKGFTVSQLSTPDREVFQHTVELGQVLVVSNSPATVRRLVEVHLKERPALSQAGDFQYMRARYRFDPAAEDGFLFLGDALVARVAGPRDKILASRRLRAQADLQAVHHAALLQGWVEGAPPADAQALLKGGWLEPEELTHFDGSPITYTLAQGASSQAWGQPWRLRPLADLPLDAVTEQEAAAYARFRDSYQRYWSGYIDPVAVQIKLEGDGLRLDGRILPLIQNSDYDELVHMAGQQTLQATPIQSGARLMLAVGQDAELRRMADAVIQEASGRQDLGLGWLGDWVMVGAADRSGLWDLALRADAIPQTGTHPDLGLLGLFKDLPLYVGAHIKNKLSLAAALTALRGYMDTAAPGLVTWEQAEPWREVPITRVRESSALRSAGEPPALYYCVAGDVLLVSLDRATLETQISLVLDGGALGEGEQTQSALLYAPSQGERSWMNQALLGLVEWGALRNHQAAARQRQVLRQGLGAAWSQATDQRAVALRWMGRDPEVFQGGTWSLRNGIPHHSLYGDPGALALPRLPVEGTPISRALRRLQGAGLHLATEGQGDHRGLRVKVTLQKR